MVRELIILPRFRRDYGPVRSHPEFDPETIAYVLDLLTAGEPLPNAFGEHRLGKRASNWAGFLECRLGADLLMIYRVRDSAVVLHRIGTHAALFPSQKES